MLIENEPRFTQSESILQTTDHHYRVIEINMKQECLKTAVIITTCVQKRST